MYYYCTYLDSNYLTKGLALYRSLLHHKVSFHLWILCFDDLAYESLKTLMLPEIHPIALADFEKGDEELLKAKDNRSRIEYYFTCTPSLSLYLLRKFPEIDLITYIDSDLFFFSHPKSIFEELAENSILIIDHRFPPEIRYKERYGIYNVGYLSFRRNNDGIQCLNWWRQRCLEWCYDRLENNRFADQKYLDDWPTRFSGVVVPRHKGAGLAPWNVANYYLHKENRQVFVDSWPLIFYHFHNFNQLGRFVYKINLEEYRVHPNLLLKRYIYGPYIKELRKANQWIDKLPDRNKIKNQISNIRITSSGEKIHKNILYSIMKKVRRKLHMVRKILLGHYWIVIAGKIY